MPRTLHQRFAGCLLGLALGDAFGAQFEGRDGDTLRKRFDSQQELLEHLPPNGLYYTDDTQMAIGVVESLLARGQIEPDQLARNFAANYEAHRGYGRGARLILEAINMGHDYRALTESLFPGGSYGNGAAMRVAPVGLSFHDELDRVWEQARLSALPTHVHPLGIEGAQVLATAVALATTTQFLDRGEFFGAIAARCESAEYSGPLRRAARVTDPRDLALFGNGIEAQSSVVTAIACFGLSPDSFEQTIANAVLLGGDTDTIAAMAGAVSGAYLGASALPQRLLAQLENGRKGREYLIQLAADLYDLSTKKGCSS